MMWNPLRQRLFYSSPLILSLFDSSSLLLISPLFSSLCLLSSREKSTRDILVIVIFIFFISMLLQKRQLPEHLNTNNQHSITPSAPSPLLRSSLSPPSPITQPPCLSCSFPLELTVPEAGKRPPADQVENQPTAVCTLSVCTHSPVAFNYSPLAPSLRLCPCPFHPRLPFAAVTSLLLFHTEIVCQPLSICVSLSFRPLPFLVSPISCPLIIPAGHLQALTHSLSLPPSFSPPITPSCIGPAAPDLLFTNQLPLFFPTCLSPLVFLLLTCSPFLPPKIDDSLPQGEWACLKMHEVTRPTFLPFLLLLLLLLPPPSPPPQPEASCPSSASGHTSKSCRHRPPKTPHNVVLGTAKL